MSVSIKKKKTQQKSRSRKHHGPPHNLFLQNLSPYALLWVAAPTGLFYRVALRLSQGWPLPEQLGSYDPPPNSNAEKLVALNLDWIQHWISCGTHLSKPTENLRGLSGSLTSPTPHPPSRHLMLITNAERLLRKRALDFLLASQKEESEPKETKAS